MPATRDRRKNSMKVNLTAALIFHGLIFLVLAFWAAHEGVLGKKLKEITVAIIPPEKKPEPEKTILQTQYKIMERRLWYGITWPSAIITYVLGFTLLYNMFGWQIPAWLLIKLCFVLGLTLYQLQNHVIFRKLQKNNYTFQLSIY